MFLENQANLRSLENDFSGVLFGFVNKIKEYWEENDTPEQRRDK